MRTIQESRNLIDLLRGIGKVYVNKNKDCTVILSAIYRGLPIGTVYAAYYNNTRHYIYNYFILNQAIAALMYPGWFMDLDTEQFSRNDNLLPVNALLDTVDFLKYSEDMTDRQLVVARKAAIAITEYSLPVVTLFCKESDVAEIQKTLDWSNDQRKEGDKK